MRRMGRAEVLEIERENRYSFALGDRHDCGIGVAQLEIGERRVDLDRASQERGREVDDLVLAGGHGAEEESGCVASDARAQQLVDLDDHGLGNDQSPAEFGHQADREGVGLVPAVRCGDERSRVGDDPQRASTSSFRYRSAARPRSSGPSPAAT